MVSIKELKSKAKTVAEAVLETEDGGREEQTGALMSTAYECTIAICERLDVLIEQGCCDDDGSGRLKDY